MSSKVQLNTIRKMLMWFFEHQGTAYITFNGVVEFSGALRYLEKVNATAPCKVTIHHLVCVAVSRVVKEFPEANARIIGHHMDKLDSVGIAMPVNLLGHEGGSKQETTISVVSRVNERSLVDLAQACQRVVAVEREGTTSNALVRAIYGIIDRMPYPMVRAALNSLDRLSRGRLVASLLYDHIDVSTLVSNVGAAFGKVDGAVFRAASLSPPQRVLHVGTLWGISSVQDDVIAVDGAPQVRPVLPIIFCFDHRLFDGVIAGRIFLRLSEILRSPEQYFGEKGERV